MLGFFLLPAFAQCINSVYIPSDNQVKCFCDKAHCPGELICKGKYCLVGVRSDEEGSSDEVGRLHQVCGWDESERPVECAIRWNKWSEVCACESDLCNIFSLLNERMDRMHYEASRKSERRGLYTASDREVARADTLNSDEESEESQRQQVGHAGGMGMGWHRSGNIVLLLIVVPLCVGGFATLFIFLNYHCKMH